MFKIFVRSHNSEVAPAGKIRGPSGFRGFCIPVALLVCATVFPGTALAQSDETPEQQYCHADGGCPFFREINYKNMQFSLDIRCGIENVERGSTQPDNVIVRGHLKATDDGLHNVAKFADDAFARETFRNIHSVADSVCSKWIPRMRLSRAYDPSILTNYKPGKCDISLYLGVYSDNAIAYATIALDGTIAVDNEKAKSILQEQREKQTLKARQRTALANQAANRASLQRSFVSRFGVTHWPALDKLTANPYAFKGTVIGIRLDFIRMISERDALFGFARLPLVLVSGVPSTRFSGSEPTILAARVVGNDSSSGALLLHLSYVGHYVCHRYDCGDFASI